MPELARGPADRELRRMIALFLKAETDIINEIGRLRSLGLADYHAVAALERVQAILRKLEDDCWTYAPQMIERQFYVNHPEVRKLPETPEKHLRGYQNAFVLTGEQTAIVQRLTMNLMGLVAEASRTTSRNLENMLIGRVENDPYRRIGLTQTAELQAAGGGIWRNVPKFTEALRRDGITAFVDKAGRNWNLHTYGSMVLRTTSRQAEVLAVLTQDPEQDLYQISAHGSTCKLCASLEGRVYSKSGQDPDFPPLAAAFGKMDKAGPDTLENSWLNIHPNCLHQLLAWTPMGRSEEEIRKIKEFSSFQKNPVTRDPRTVEQVEAYRRKERDRARWLRDYRQWEQYRKTLGDKVPKRFETFRRHKLAGDEKYKLWKLDCQRRDDLLLHPEKALPGVSLATAAEAKFTKYFFNPMNEKGFKKGLAFTSRLGYDINNWEKMRAEILAVAPQYPAVFKSEDQFGKRYEQLVVLQGLKNNPANVLVAWNVNANGTVHMTTVHMEEIK